jgi:LacI family transcriptional regulator
VAGFDDITTLRDVVPPLTTVHVALDAVASEAIDRALNSTSSDRAVPAYPIIRASTPALTAPAR